MDSVLLQAFIYLMAAVVAVPVAKRLGLGSVLGYLIAGVIIGPVVGLVGSETNDLQHFAEFGVVMMLFICRSGTRTKVAMGDAPQASGSGWLAGTVERFVYRRCRLLAGACLASVSGCRHGVFPVLHRHCVANVE